MAQTAKALGAKTVIGFARNPEKLQRALKYGADFVISTQDKQIKDIRKRVSGDLQEERVGSWFWLEDF